MVEQQPKREQSAPSSELLKSIFEQCFDSVYAYVAYRVAPDFDAARDITQETFLACCETMSNYRGEASRLTWLRAIARNKVVDHVRRAKKDVACEFDAAALDQVSVKHNRAHSEAREQAVLVGAVMRRVPKHYADVLEAKYLDDLPVEEIARRCNKTAKAIESILTRARNAFRVAYDELTKREGVRS